ncbi:MAG: transcriptional regulator, TetR family [Acidobacteriaceae bacterium]|nr:transcriptional regulator, TetR family [Acidobacteriaceae bacterium]
MAKRVLKSATKKKSDTRDKILLAAFKAFHEKGYNGTSIQDIIEAANVPKASSYNHFRSKEQLALEVLSLYALTVQDGMAGSAEPSPIGLLRTYFERWITQHEKWGFETGCMIGNFTAEISNSEEVLRAFVIRTFDFWNAAIADLLVKAQEKGVIPATQNPKELASYILNSYHGAVLRGKLTRDRTPYDQFLTHTFDYLLKHVKTSSIRRSTSKKKR